MAEHVCPPLRRHGEYSSRKYQQRLRWHKLPPSVAMLRTCGPAISPAAIASAGNRRRRPAWAAIAAGVTPAPMETELAPTVIVLSPAIALRLTTITVGA